MNQREYDMPNCCRVDWTFRYKPAEVLEAAKKCAKHHLERLQWWKKELEKTEKELRKKGFEYREREETLGTHVQIVGDPELSKRASQCREKIFSHQEAQRVYETWARALLRRKSRQPKDELELKLSDIVYFEL